jgi:hypothetical protein
MFKVYIQKRYDSSLPVLLSSQVTYDSLLVLFLYIFGNVYLSKIDDDVVCLSFADNVVRFGRFSSIVLSDEE